jgi:hypothetical protein
MARSSHGHRSTRRSTSQVAFGTMTTFLAILTGGGLAAVCGLISGLLTNWLGDKRDQRKYEHERAMALDARRQERLEKAFLELLGLVGSTSTR